MNIEEMRRRMEEHFDSFTPEAFCDMLESKYGLKQVEPDRTCNIGSEGIPVMPIVSELLSSIVHGKYNWVSANNENSFGGDLEIGEAA